MRLSLNHKSVICVKFTFPRFLKQPNTTTYTVKVDDQQSEEVIKAFLDAMGMDYEVHIKNEVKRQNSTPSMEEQELFNRLKNALCEIKKWGKSEVELNDARTFINGLSG